jgi:hypothetical protein
MGSPASHEDTTGDLKTLTIHHALVRVMIMAYQLMPGEREWTEGRNTTDA